MAGVPAGGAAAVRAGGGGGQHHLRERGPEPQVRGHYVNSINTGLIHKDFLCCIVNYINKKNILEFTEILTFLAHVVCCLQRVQSRPADSFVCLSVAMMKI